MSKYVKFFSLCVIYLISRNILFSEVTANNSYKLFYSVYDQAQTIYDYPFFDKRFNNLGSDYFYIGSHLDKISNYTKGAYIDLKAGYYRKEGDTPFSITGKFFVSPNVINRSLINITNTGVGVTNFKYKNIPYYSVIGGELNFLIDIKDILSTGIYASFSYSDKSFISTNMSYVVGGIQNEEYNVFNQNGSFYELNIAVPVYFRMSNFKHYFEAGFTLRNTMMSNGTYIKQFGFTQNESNRYENIYSYTPSLMYRFGYVLSENTAEFQAEAKFGFTLLKHNLVTVTKSFLAIPTDPSEINVYSNMYETGFYFNIKAGFMLQFFKDNNYIKLRAFPALGYSFEISPYITSSKYLTTGNIQRLSPFNKKEVELHSITLYTPIALNIHNKDWAIGVILALDTEVTYNYQKSKTDIYALGTNGYNDISYFTSYNSYFDYIINPQIGIYFPFDNGKIIETSINFRKDFYFESFDIRFSMPITIATKSKTGTIKPIKKEKPKDAKLPREEKSKSEVKTTPATESVKKGLQTTKEDKSTGTTPPSTTQPIVDPSKDKNNGIEQNNSNKGEVLDIPFIGKVKRKAIDKLTYKF